MIPELGDMSSISEVVDKPNENVVKDINRQDLLQESAMPDSVRGAG